MGSRLDGGRTTSEQKKYDEEQKAKSDARNKELTQYAFSQGLDPNSFTGDQTLVGGLMQGRSRAQELYGMTNADMGQDFQSEVYARRKQALDGNDPATTRLREGRNAQMRAASASGATDAQKAQINRSASQDIGQQEFTSQNEALGKFQSLLGNVMGNSQSLELGYGGLAKSGEEIDVPEQANTLGTVICTELYRQGYMTNETLIKDRAYGVAIRATNPHVYTGYLLLATPVVSLMRRSKLITKLVSIPALAWANDMAYDNSLIGKIINKLGQPICGLVGRIANLKGVRNA